VHPGCRARAGLRHRHLRYDVRVDAASFVRELRARHGLSQSALAYRAGTTQQAISRIEHGRVSPTVEMLARLAAAAGEELVLAARPREVPFDPDQLAAASVSPMAERLERAMSWNLFAGDIAAAGARAREPS
jgi:transcriptional regulator with XRE-family HTH domain